MVNDHAFLFGLNNQGLIQETCLLSRFCSLAIGCYPCWMRQLWVVGRHWVAEMKEGADGDCERRKRRWVGRGRCTEGSVRGLQQCTGEERVSQCFSSHTCPLCQAHRCLLLSTGFLGDPGAEHNSGAASGEDLGEASASWCRDQMLAVQNSIYRYHPSLRLCKPQRDG